MKVVITHWVHAEVEAYLGGFAQVVAPTEPGAVWSRQEVIAEAGDADALITSMADSVDDEFLASCPRLKIIAATLKGLDSYDVDACARRNVWLTNVPDIIVAPTAELAVALVLAVMRNVPQGDRAVRSVEYAGWRPQLYGRTLAGSVVGMIGMGQLGTAIGTLLDTFGLAELLYFDDKKCAASTTRLTQWRRVDIVTLMRKSDTIIVALPLTSTTRYLVDSALLQHLKPGSYLVNVGRGSVVSERAVLAALQDGALAGYATDVFELEDWALSDRLESIPVALREHPRTVFTPHLGSAVDDVRREMSMISAKQVRQALHGEVPEHAANLVDT